MSSAQRSRSGHLDVLASGCGGLLQGREKGLDRLGCEIFVVVVVDLNHGGIDTGTQALDLNESEKAIFCCVSGLDAQVLFDSFEDLGATAATELAGCLINRSR